MDWTCAAESSATAGGGLEEFDEELVPPQEMTLAERSAAKTKRKFGGRAAREFFRWPVLCFARRSEHLRTN